MNNDLAEALADAPRRVVDIRLVLRGGEFIDSAIGEQTVQNWSQVYGER
ncbi:MAG: hypothetical protein ACFBSC_05510 [Microcoleaceae cyanobacterium]